MLLGSTCGRAWWGGKQGWAEDNNCDTVPKNASDNPRGVLKIGWPCEAIPHWGEGAGPLHPRVIQLWLLWKKTGWVVAGGNSPQPSSPSVPEGSASSTPSSRSSIPDGWARWHLPPTTACWYDWSRVTKWAQRRVQGWVMHVPVAL